MSDSRPTKRAKPGSWRVLGEEPIARCAVFDVERAAMESPSTGRAHAFYRIRSPSWVNVVALTPEDELVLVRQFRQGARAHTLEVPGGIIDPGESPEEAGLRELLEETGYRADRIESLGSLNPNPALFDNRFHMAVALDCVRVAEIDNGLTEETSVELVPRRDLRALLARNEFDHALAVCALYAFERWQAG